MPKRNNCDNSAFNCWTVKLCVNIYAAGAFEKMFNLLRLRSETEVYLK